VSSQTAMHQWN